MPLWLLASLAAIPGFAQSVSARLDGVVRDASGAVVVKAAVTALQDETGARSDALTNESGQYVFPNLLPGPYTVSAEFTGFKKAGVKDIVLRIGDARRLDLTLAPGAVSESVDVTAEATTVDTATTRIGAVVENRQAVDLPLNGRDAMMLFCLQAGTNP